MTRGTVLIVLVDRGNTTVTCTAEGARFYCCGPLLEELYTSPKTSCHGLGMVKHKRAGLGMVKHKCAS